MQITLMRIDTRLIHGQVAIKWSNHAHAQNIYVVDKDTAANAFMSKFYKSAAPKSVKQVEVYSPEALMEAYNAGTVAEGNTFLVFKDVQNCYELWKLGFPFEAVDVGNQAMKPGKKQILREVFLSEQEYEQLKEMHEANIDVYIQIIPEQSRYDFKTIASKMGR